MATYEELFSRTPFRDRETKRCRLLDFFRIADCSEIGGCLKLEIKLYMEEEMFTIKPFAAPTRPRRFRLRLTRTGFIPASLIKR